MSWNTSCNVPTHTCMSLVPNFVPKLSLFLFSPSLPYSKLTAGLSHSFWYGDEPHCCQAGTCFTEPHSHIFAYISPYGCCNKPPQIVWLRTILFLHISEIQKSESCGSVGFVLWRGFEGGRLFILSPWLLGIAGNPWYCSISRPIIPIYYCNSLLRDHFSLVFLSSIFNRTARVILSKPRSGPETFIFLE